MRKNLILLFSCISLLFTAQKDSFDYILTYESKRETPKKGSYKKQLEQIAINSVDASYFMYLYEDRTARLFDFQNYFVYYFNVNSRTKQLMSNLKMTGSAKLPSPNLTYYSAKKLSNEEFLLQVFADVEMKNSTTDIKVKIKEAPVNLLFITADILPHNIHLVSKFHEILDPKKNYVIESSRVDYKNGYLFVKTLKDYQKIEK